MFGRGERSASAEVLMGYDSCEIQKTAKEKKSDEENQVFSHSLPGLHSQLY
jgi:hypothetical protein